MIELGSNQAYYSCLFRAIIDGVNNNKKCFNVMLEPNDNNVNRGIDHFKMNGFHGSFVHAGIGNGELSDRNTTLPEIMRHFNMHELDILHCDIDGYEIQMLETSGEIFSKKLIRYVFMSVHHDWTESEQASFNSHLINVKHKKHRGNRYWVCRDELDSLGYKLLTNVDTCAVGGDYLLIYER
jgi:hypothetical protein